MIIEKVKAYLKEIEKNNKKGKKINAILQVNPKVLEEAKIIDEKIKKGKAGKLAGKVIAVKSNINVLGLNASCASNTLKDYICGYDATAIKKIKEEDGIIIAMTNMDEFASGASGESSAFGPTKNPTTPATLNLIPGGSSCGSIASVAAGFCDLTLGSDTGGSIRNPASHCGVIGVKPSYGAVSRYGLIDLSMSLDQIAPAGKDIEGVKLLFDVIKGKDEKDATTFNIKPKQIKNKIGKIKIALPKIKVSNQRIWQIVKEKVKQTAEKNKWQVKEIELRHIDLAVQTYYLLAYVEFFSATRRFDGRRYGKKIEDVCGKEVLRRILGGSEITKAEYAGKYYRRALIAKQLIKEEFEKAFEKFDCIIMPTVPKLPHKIGAKISVEEMYFYDTLTTPPNLAGNCAISIPAGKINGIPVGMQIICDKFQEDKMFKIAEEFV